MVLVALLLTVLLGFLGFVLNAGHVTSVRGELQNASDAAALAAARELNGQATGVTSARTVAANYSTLHDTDTTSTIDINSVADVNFCNWSAATRSITWCLGFGVTPTTAAPPVPTPGATTQLQAVNAVQVQNGRETSRENSVPVWLSAFLGGTTHVDTRSTATAIGGGPISLPPGTACLPMAYVDCALSSGCNAPIVYRNNNTDTAGFTLLDDGNVSASGINRFLANGTCPPTYAGQLISLNNGNISAANVWNQLKTLVGGEYAMPIVHSDTCKINASNPFPIIGYATIRITGVYRNSGDNPSPECGGLTPCITAVVTCDQQTSGSPGGLNFGLPTVRTQLVQ
jgi:Flp pilus assembly protein TadG